MIQKKFSPHAEYKKKGFSISSPSGVNGYSCRLNKFLSAVKVSKRDKMASNMGTVFHMGCEYALSNPEAELDDLFLHLEAVLDELETEGLWSMHYGQFFDFDWHEEKYQLDCTSGKVAGREPVIITAREAWTERLQEALIAWWEYYRPMFEPVSIEETIIIESPENKHVLIATPDLVAVNKETGRLTVVDWKTTQRKGKADFKHRIMPQLNIYSAAYAHKHDLEVYPDTAIVEFVWSMNKSYPTVRHEMTPPISPTQAQVALALKRAEQSKRARDAQFEEDWVPIPANCMECDLCEHTEECINFTDFDSIKKRYKGVNK